jgi:hypothetical protein
MVVEAERSLIKRVVVDAMLRRHRGCTEAQVAEVVRAALNHRTFGATAVDAMETAIKDWEREHGR